MRGYELRKLTILSLKSLEHLKITTNDIIQAIIFNEYERNKNYSKKSILHNALKSNGTKYTFSRNTRAAIKNINHEMEEAAQEFSKLFNYEEKNI